MEGLSKKYLRIVWLTLVIGVLALYYFFPGVFSYDYLEQLIAEDLLLGSMLIFGIHIVRSFTFIPASPLIVLSVVVFPDSPWFLLLVNWLGMSLSAMMLFLLSYYLDFNQFLEKKPKTTAKITHRLNSPSGFWYIFIWSFVPVFSSDLMCFIAGSLKLRFPQFILAFSMGTIIMCGFYIYGTSIIQLQF